MGTWAFTELGTANLIRVFTGSTVGYVYVTHPTDTLHASSDYLASDVTRTPSPAFSPISYTQEVGGGDQFKVYLGAGGQQNIFSIADPIGGNVWVDEGYNGSGATKPAGSVVASKSGANIRLFVASQGNGPWRRPSFGGTWTQPTGVPFNSPTAPYLNCAVWQTTSMLIVYDSANGMYKSFDGGNTFNQIWTKTTGDSTIVKFLVAPGGQYGYLLLSTGDIWRVATINDNGQAPIKTVDVAPGNGLLTAVDTAVPEKALDMCIAPNGAIYFLSVVSGTTQKIYGSSIHGAGETWGVQSDQSFTDISGDFTTMAIDDTYIYVISPSTGVAQGTYRRVAGAIEGLSGITVVPSSISAGAISGVVTLNFTPVADQIVRLIPSDAGGRDSPRVNIPTTVIVPANQSTITYSGTVSSGGSGKLGIYAGMTTELPQNSPNPNTNPIGAKGVPDLGTGYYVDGVGDSWQGGLYPGGSNVPPADYLARGLAAGQAITPRDINGVPSAAGNAYVVLASIGYSNVFREFSDWTNDLQNAVPGFVWNPQVRFANGASPGHTLFHWVNPPGTNPDQTTIPPDASAGKVDFSAWTDPAQWKITHSILWGAQTITAASWSPPNGGTFTFTLAGVRHNLGPGVTGSIAGMTPAGYNLASLTIATTPTTTTFTVTGVGANPGAATIMGAFTPTWVIGTNSFMWDHLEHLCSFGGKSMLQVQAIYLNMAVIGIKAIMKNLDPRFTGHTFRENSLADLKQFWLTGMRAIRSYATSRFPNLKQIFLTTVSWGGYRSVSDDDFHGTDEPYSYFFGHCVKEFINDSINDPTLVWTGWGPYWWADQLVPNQDGLYWRLEDSLDGTHLNPRGNIKTSLRLQQHFSTSQFTPWFNKAVLAYWTLDDAVKSILDSSTRLSP